MAEKAEQLVRALKEQHENLRAYFGGEESKAPGWFLHLPSGDVWRIRRMQAAPPLVRFWGTDAAKEFVDVILVAPESVVLSIRTLEPEDEVYEIEISTNGSGPAFLP